MTDGSYEGVVPRMIEDGKDGMGKLQGRRAVVTGAARGIGKAIAERFTREAAEVILADVAAEDVEAVAQALGQRSVCADLSASGGVDAVFAAVEREWGSLDILVNNAGVTHAASLDELQEADFDRVFAINLKAALFATQRAARLMGEGSAIINMSSVNALLAIPNQIPYAISKGAMRQLTNVSALALAPRGIRVNAIGPGTIETELARSILIDKAAEDRILSRTPLGRMGTPEEIAAVALFLACEDSSYITGQTIYPDGGRLGLNYTVQHPAR